MDSRLSYLRLPLEVHGTEISQGRVAARRIVEALDVVEHVCRRDCACGRLYARSARSSARRRSSPSPQQVRTRCWKEGGRAKMETPLTKQATGRRRCAERGGVNPAVGRLLLWGRLGMFAVESYAAAGHPAEGVESRPQRQLQMLSLAEPHLANRTLSVDGSRVARVIRRSDVGSGAALCSACWCSR